MQVRDFVTRLLRRHLDDEHAGKTAPQLSEGRWTHDFPIDVDHAGALGLPVSTELPNEVRHLMRLYPQPRGRRLTVEYIPSPCSGAPWPGAGPAQAHQEVISLATPATRLLESALGLLGQPRDEAVEQFVALADHRRPGLEAARDALVARLHRRPDDFDAAHALQLVERALRQVGWPGNALPELHQAEGSSSPSLVSRLRQRFRREAPASDPAPRHGPSARIA